MSVIIKLVFLLFLSTLTVYAGDRHKAIDTYQLSNDGVHYVNLKAFENLEDAKAFWGETIFHKLILNKKILNDATYYLKSLGNAEHLISISVPYSVVGDDLIFKIDTTSPTEILIETQSRQASEFMLFDILTPYEYEEIYPMEKFWFGLVYGVMFYAFLNSLIFFLYNRQISFLYYALLQFSLVLLLMNFTYWSYFYAELEKYVNILSLSIDLSILFAILFNMAFLQTKKNLPTIHKVEQLFIVLTLTDMLGLFIWHSSTVFAYLPPYYLPVILLVSAFLMMKKGLRSAVYYFVGWSVVVVGVIIASTRVFDLSSIYIIHIIFPFETVVFSFVLGYQLIALQKRALHHEKMLMQQSKLASMGEMLANIAHQWRQPLNNIASIMMHLNAAQKHNDMSEELFVKKSRQIDEQLAFMSETIEDFRSFMVLEKEKTPFLLQPLLERSFGLAASHMTDLVVDLRLNVDENLEIVLQENELSHVIFNLCNNAIDAFVDKKIPSPYIEIAVLSTPKLITITVEDNAGGIPKKIIKKIFEPYFSTKEKGMGIGLYMSKLIVKEHMGGTLSVKNVPDGAKFEIKLSRK